MNKTIWLRLIACLIVLASLLTVFAACDTGSDAKDNNNQNGNEEATNAEAEATPDSVGISKKNYDDEFYLSILPDTNPMKYFWV